MHRGRNANEEYDSWNCFRVWLTQGWVLHAAQDRFHCFLGSHQELIPAWAGAEQSSLLSRNPLLSPSGVKQRLGYSGARCFQGQVSTNACAKQSSLGSAQRETKLTGEARPKSEEHSHPFKRCSACLIMAHL